MDQNKIWCAVVSLACELTAWLQMLALHDPEQAVHAQERYDAGNYTVQQIADLLKTPRPTIYGHLNKEKASAANRNPPNNPADFLGRLCATTTPCPIVRIYLAFLILDATVQCLG